MNKENERIPLISPKPKYGRLYLILLNLLIVTVIIWQFMGKTFETFLTTSLIAYLLIAITLFGLVIAYVRSQNRGKSREAMLSVGNAALLLIIGVLVTLEVFRGDARFSYDSLKYYGVSSDSFEVQVESIKINGVIHILESDYDPYNLPLIIYMESAGDPGVYSPRVWIDYKSNPASLVVNGQDVAAPESSVVVYNSESEECVLIESVQWSEEIISDRNELERFVTMIYKKYRDTVQPIPTVLER